MVGLRSGHWPSPSLASGEPRMRWTLRIAGLLLVGLGCVFGGNASASDFAERLAAWNVGPVHAPVLGPASGAVAPTAYEEPAAPRAPSRIQASSQPAASSPVTAAPQSQWEQMAFGHRDAYGYPGAGYAEGSNGGCSVCGDCSAFGEYGPAGCDMCCGRPL